MTSIDRIIMEQVSGHTCQRLEPSVQAYLQRLTAPQSRSPVDTLKKADHLNKLIRQSVKDQQAPQLPFLFDTNMETSGGRRSVSLLTN